LSHLKLPSLGGKGAIGFMSDVDSALIKHITPAFSFRRTHVVNGTVAGDQTDYQVKIRCMYGFYDPCSFVSAMDIGYWEGIVYLVYGGFLWWGTGYAGSPGPATGGFIYKTNLVTKVSSRLYTGDYYTAWQGLRAGGFLFTFGEESPGVVGKWFACIKAVNLATDAVTSAAHPQTGDCNEFIGVDTDGTDFVVGERVIGGVGPSLWPNGGGVWRIPIATWSNTGTWVRTWEDPNHYEWASVAYFNGKWYAMLHNVGNPNNRWRVVSSADLVNWVTELDYTAQNVGFSGHSSLLKCGSFLVALAPVAATMTFHLFVLDGGAWADHDLGIAIPAVDCAIGGLWDSVRAKLIVIVSPVAARTHTVYEVNLDGSGLKVIYTNNYGAFSLPQSDQSVYTKFGDDVFYGIVASTALVVGREGCAFRLWHADHDDACLLKRNCRTDFADVRFTDVDAVSKLSYWAERVVSSEFAEFWVKIPSIPAAGSATIYVYSGKSAASSLSSGVATFIFFEDFSGDLSKWDIATGTWVISAGMLRRTGANGNSSIYSDATILTPGSGYAVHGYYLIPAKAAMDLAVGLSFQKDVLDPPSGFYTFYVNFAGGHINWYIYRWTGAGWVNVCSGWGEVLSANFYYTKTSAGAFSLYVERFLLCSGNNAVVNDCGQNLYVRIYAWQQDTYFDNIFVRRFASPEPSHGVWGVVQRVNYYPY